MKGRGLLEDSLQTDVKRWSYSRLSCFEHCKYAFYLRYIVNDDEQYLAEGNYYAEVGSYVHEILAMIFNGELSEDDAAQYYVDHYEENVCYKVRKSTMTKTYEACADYFAEVDFSWLKDYEIIGVELKTPFVIDNEPCIGFIDLLLRDKKTGEIVLVDHKSAAYPLKKDGSVLAKSKESFESYKKQMYLYCHAVNQIFGEFPAKIVWNHFKDGKIVQIDFNKTEYDEAMEWFKNIVKDVKKEEEFEPTQDFFYCSTLCDYRNCCEYRQFDKES